MKKFNTGNLGSGFIYFYIHFVTEVICFFALGRYFEGEPTMWLIILAYDLLAFAPQSVIGYINDRFPRFSFGIAGLLLLAAALVLQNTVSSPFVSLVPLCIGNAFVHVNGAEVTLRASNGSLSHSAIFVSGGSFGVVSGKLLAATDVPYWLLLFLIVSAIPFAVLGQTYVKDAAPSDRYEAFDYHRKGLNKYVVIILSVLVVIVRGYMAYGIPISWRKTTLQTIILFVFMGIGKALGGVLADIFGVKKVAMLSILLALPLLMFGDNNMFVSLFGVLLFSMTMSISLAVIVSVLKRSPGLAFGLTTIGLFLGSLPTFFVKIRNTTANCVMLSVLTAVCLICLFVSIRKEAGVGKSV